MVLAAWKGLMSGTGPMQAAYHGVPVVALPFQEFQPENAAKMIARVRHPYPDCAAGMIVLSLLPTSA